MKQPKTTRAAIEALRREWETDPSITFAALARRFDSATAVVQSHARRNGWARTPEIQMQAKTYTAARNLANIHDALARGYVPSTDAATSARLGRDAPVQYKKERRYPAWDTRQKETEHPPPERYASVFHYGSGVMA